MYEGNSAFWTAEQHREALKRIDEIFDAEPGTPEGFELNWLTDAIVLYEDKYHPIGE